MELENIRDQLNELDEYVREENVSLCDRLSKLEARFVEITAVLDSFKTKYPDMLEKIALCESNVASILSDIADIKTKLPRPKPLSQRQATVLSMIKTGKTQREIACELGFSKQYISAIVRVLRKKCIDV